MTNEKYIHYVAGHIITYTETLLDSTNPPSNVKFLSAAIGYSYSNDFPFLSNTNTNAKILSSEVSEGTVSNDLLFVC